MNAMFSTSAKNLAIAAHKAHGSRVRYFARYLGLLAKTDPIDARVLALYGLKTTIFAFTFRRRLRFWRSET